MAEKTDDPHDTVVRIHADMSLEERRAAVDALAKGARTVEMPAGETILAGRVLDAGDPWRPKGDVTLQAFEGQVRAERHPAMPETRTSRNFLRYGTSFTGALDPGTGRIRGTVVSELTRPNIPYAVGSICAALLVGGFFGVGAHRWWVFAVVAVLAGAAFLKINLVTRRREAQWIVPDLERMAALAAGRTPVHRMSFRAPAEKGGARHG